jgi:hypothetical protein
MTRDEWLQLQDVLALTDDLVRELIGRCEQLGFTPAQQEQLWAVHAAVTKALDEAAAVIGGTP